MKYEGYVARQEVEIARQERLSEKRIPEAFDYRIDRASTGRSARKAGPGSPGQSGPGESHQRHHAGRPGAADDPPGVR